MDSSERWPMRECCGNGRGCSTDAMHMNSGMGSARRWLSGGNRTCLSTSTAWALRLRRFTGKSNADKDAVKSAGTAPQAQTEPAASFVVLGPMWKGAGGLSACGNPTRPCTGTAWKAVSGFRIRTMIRIFRHTRRMDLKTGILNGSGCPRQMVWGWVLSLTWST